MTVAVAPVACTVSVVDCSYFSPHSLLAKLLHHPVCHSVAAVLVVANWQYVAFVKVLFSRSRVSRQNINTQAILIKSKHYQIAVDSVADW